MNEGGMWNRSKEGQYGKVIFTVTKKVRIRKVYRRNSFGNFKTGWIPIYRSAIMNII